MDNRNYNHRSCCPHTSNAKKKIKKDDYKRSNKNTTSEISKEKKVDDTLSQTSTPQDNPLAALVGTYNGSSSLLTQSLVFPTSELNISNNGVITLIGSGLNLSILGNPALAVNGIYPDVELTVMGTVAPESATTLVLSVTDIQPVFNVDAAGTKTPVDAATSQLILEGLTQAGITIPTVSATTPAVLQTEFTMDPTGLTIQTVETSQIFASFQEVK
ncbi:MAG: hypothetical protein HC932_02225 [Thermales bacterium]|nr:hypothetical protein [Thermales bacterium]